MLCLEAQSVCRQLPGVQPLRCQRVQHGATWVPGAEHPVASMQCRVGQQSTNVTADQPWSRRPCRAGAGRQAPGQQSSSLGSVSSVQDPLGHLICDRISTCCQPATFSNGPCTASHMVHSTGNTAASQAGPARVLLTVHSIVPSAGSHGQTTCVSGSGERDAEALSKYFLCKQHWLSRMFTLTVQPSAAGLQESLKGFTAVTAALHGRALPVHTTTELHAQAALVALSLALLRHHWARTGQHS